MLDKKKYNIQRNFCKKLFRTTKEEYFNNLDTKKVTDNITFWGTVGTVVSLFPYKNSKYKTISDEKESCRTFSTYSVNIISDLQIPNIHKDAYNIRSNYDTVLAAINTRFKVTRASLISNKEFNSTFSFKNTNENEVGKIMKNVNASKLIKVVTFQ